jgi:DNA adenine methylase
MSVQATLDRFPSPLRYPGGKGKLANFVKLLLTANDMADVHYVEPYAGGASIALSLLFEEYARHIHINDVNRAIYAVWYSVLNETEALCRLIRDTDVTLAIRERQRAVQVDSDATLLELGFSTFFLNRVNRSGIIRGGVIGGKNQNGAWGIDARYNKLDLIQRVKKIARYRQRIHLSDMDAAEFIAQRIPSLPANTLTYLDPPYYGKGKDLYQHFYTDADHATIASLVPSIAQPWIVSYDAHAKLLPLYEGYRSIRYGLSYSAQERYKGPEVIFFSPSLRIPAVPSPANIKLKEVVAAEADAVVRFP